ARVLGPSRGRDQGPRERIRQALGGRPRWRYQGTGRPGSEIGETAATGLCLRAQQVRHSRLQRRVERLQWHNGQPVAHSLDVWSRRLLPDASCKLVELDAPPALPVMWQVILHAMADLHLAGATDVHVFELLGRAQVAIEAIAARAAPRPPHD